jgi:CRP-like cAMP-binding protein
MLTPSPNPRSPASRPTGASPRPASTHRRATPMPPRPALPAPYRAGDGDPDTLQSLDLFAGLPCAEIEEFATRCTVSTAHPGQVVQAQDVPVRMWHVITAGHAVVQRDGRPIGLLGRGDSWSEHSILNQLPSSIAVVALSPLTLLTVSQRAFFEIPDHHPVLAGRLVARAASSADRLALPVFNALVQLADTKCTGRCRDGQYD